MVRVQGEESSLSNAEFASQGWGYLLEPGEEGLAGGGGAETHQRPPLACLQWDLVCEQRGLNKVISTCFFIGVLLGAVVYGYLSDR